MHPRARRAAAAVAAVFVVLAAAPATVAAQAWDLPSLDPVLNYQPRQSLRVFTADGVEIAQFGAERRQFVPIAQVPRLLQDAVIAVEDARFRDHAGIDPRGIARALLAAVTGGLRQGASTITQQVARTFFLTPRFTPERKAKEIMLALRIEQALSKDRILELYLNEIYLGQRAYGFAAAAQVYFGKPLARLTLAETAMLAGLPQNPQYANPVDDLARATHRQRIVLQRMRETGVITAAQEAAARAEPLAVRAPGHAPVHAGHVAEMARLAVVDRYGSSAYTAGLRVVTSLRAADQQAAWAAVRRGLLNHGRNDAWRGPEAREALPAGAGADVQRAAARALKEHRDDEMLRVAIVLDVSPREVRVQLASGETVAVAGDGLRLAAAGLKPKAPAALALGRGAVVRVLRSPGAANAAAAGPAVGTPAEAAAGERWSIVQWPQAQGALVALDTASGRVRAMVGGFDFSRQPFNHATQAWRQPGSSFKPLLFSAALEQGLMPASVVDDAPFVGVDGWAPQNSDGRHDGPIGLRAALARSRNLVSVRLLQRVGTPAVRDWVARFGLDRTLQPANLTLALGAGSVTPLQLATAYAVLANGGWRVDPVVIERIVDAQGRVVFEAPAPRPLAEDARAIPARNAFLMQSLLNDVTRVGTAARAQRDLRRPDVFGKTGTTNDAVDAWFAGFHPSLAAVVWIGHDDPRSLGDRESGGGLALPVWTDYMAVALKGVPVAPAAEPPPGLVRSGDDWLYAEWADGGWVERIDATGAVTIADPARDALAVAPSPIGPSPPSAVDPLTPWNGLVPGPVDVDTAPP